MNITIGGTATPISTPLPVASTIDGTNDLLPIYTANLGVTQAISRSTLLGVAGQPADLTSSQTMTNKVLTAPAISGPTLSGTILGTYTLGGTPTFPATVVTTTGTQALTNKTITSPSITGGTLDNATVTVDSVAGHTVAGTGTIYGLGIVAGAFTTANIIPAISLQSASVTASKLATGALAATIATNETSTSTSYIDLATPGPAVTVAIGANGLALVCLGANMANNTASGDGALTSFAISGANTLSAGTTPYVIFYQTWTANALGEFGRTWLVTGLSAGSTTFTAKYAAFAGGTAAWKNRSIAVVPL